MEISRTLSLNSISFRASSSSASLGSCNYLFPNNGQSLHSKKKQRNSKNSISLVLSRSGARKGLNCQCLFGLGIPELVVIGGVAALLFGPKNLPVVGKSIGKTVKSFQQAAKEFESELKKEPEPETDPPTQEPTAISEEQKQDTKISNPEQKSS